MSTVASGASYPTVADVVLTFEPDQIILKADSGTFLFSFDGVNDHGKLASTEGFITIATKRKQIWLKQSGGASTARVMAFTLA